MKIVGKCGVWVWRWAWDVWVRIDRDFVGGWDGVGRSWASFNGEPYADEVGWMEGTVVAKNRVRMCVWVIETKAGQWQDCMGKEEGGYSSNIWVGMAPLKKQQNCFPSSPLRTNTFLFFSCKESHNEQATAHPLD